MGTGIWRDVPESKIEDVVRSFYGRAFKDPIIGHFFFGLEHEELVEHQTKFTLNLLGYTHVKYQGRPLKSAHYLHDIRQPHYGRRQVLLQQEMERSSFSSDQIRDWIKKEEKLRGQILRNPPSNSPL